MMIFYIRFKKEKSASIEADIFYSFAKVTPDNASSMA